MSALTSDNRSPSDVELEKNYRLTPADNEFLSNDDLAKHVAGCAANDRQSQKVIYMSFYGYAIAICMRYSKTRDDAIEIVNDGFLKIFKEIYRYKPAYADEVSSFKGWLRRIMIYTAIDHFRKHGKHNLTSDINDGIIQVAASSENAIDRISHAEIKASIHELTPAYRAVFNLFVIEDLTHEEIAQRLQISIGTSKSNLAKARKQLQKILAKKNEIQFAQ